MRRFSIATLMVIVLVCGVGMAALMNASKIWAGLMSCVTLLILAASLVAIPYRRNGSRAFWVGFAVFGCGYMLIQSVPKLWNPEAQSLPTDGLLSFLHERFNTDEVMLAAKPLASLGISVGGPPGGPEPLEANFLAKQVEGQTVIVSSTRPDFMRVGNCLFALLVALLGGGIARWFHRTKPVAS